MRGNGWKRSETSSASPTVKAEPVELFEGFATDPLRLDKFDGFIGGETNQWAPALFDGTARVEVPTTPITTSTLT
jgi:hypothetical protein